MAAGILDLRPGDLHGARRSRQCMWGPPIDVKESGRCVGRGGAKEYVDDCFPVF